MQILWKKYTKENFEMNVDECGIEQGIPGFGYKYEVLKNAVIHYISKGMVHLNLMIRYTT